MDFDTLVHELEQGADIIKALVTGISQAEAQIKPNAEDWSILEVVGHLVDEERDDFRMRVDLTLNHPGQQWPPIHPSAWVTERAYNQRDLAESLNEFLAERAKSIAFLRSLQSPDWTAMHHSEYGDRTAGQLLASWVAHDHLHMRQLIELRWRRVQTITAPYDTSYAGDW